MVLPIEEAPRPGTVETMETVDTWSHGSTHDDASPTNTTVSQTQTRVTPSTVTHTDTFSQCRAEQAGLLDIAAEALAQAEAGLPSLCSQHQLEQVCRLVDTKRDFSPSARAAARWARAQAGLPAQQGRATT